MVRNRVTIIRRAAFAGLVALLGGCATFEGEIPVATDLQDPTYISPKNADGTQDALVVPVAVTSPYDRMVLGGYRLAVTDAAGTVVWQKEEVSVPRGTVARGRATAVTVPAHLSWDGKDTSGAWVPDGEYRFSVTAWDTKGNEGESPQLAVVVDNTTPAVTLSVSSQLFSPDGDGNLDELTIAHGGATTEGEWRGEIRNEAGQTLRREQWAGTPAALQWDGTDAEGRTAPDGVYVYTVSSIDLAGNRAEVASGPITVDTRRAEATLGVTFRQLSPNGDGVRDTTQLLLRPAIPDFVAGWSIAVHDASGSVRRSIAAEGRAPERVEFDGKDLNGAVVPDGRYSVELSLAYRNGATTKAVSPPLVVDTTPPRAAVVVDFAVFSPDGDGSRDTVTIRQDSSEEEDWEGRFSDRAGLVVATRSWEGVAPTFQWDGKDSGGAPLPDGTYAYVLSSTDESGNSTPEKMTTVRLDKRPATAGLSPSAPVLSPNGDGVRDSVELELSSTPADGIESWRLRILDARGNAVAAPGEGGAALPPRISWNGRSTEGSPVEGALTAELVVQYERGVVARASRPLTSDLTAPNLSVAATPALFSPDGDGVDDTLSIRLGAVDPSGIGVWSARVLDPGGQLFMEWSGSGTPRSPITWNGKSASGELVQSAEDYTLVLQATDAVGNRGTARSTIPIDILVIRDGDRLRIVITSIYFKSFTADYRDVPADRARDNLQTLSRLAQKLQKFPQYRIRVEGHAVSIYWNDARRKATEERTVLAPLSLARAGAVRAALAERGVEPRRMSVAGYGGMRPVVPNSDLTNRWKNRRVEFILEGR